MIDLSQYPLEPLRQDVEFILRCLHTKAKTSPPSILALSPVMAQPAPATIKKIKHAFKDDLNPTWAIRRIAFTQQQSRTMLLFEDPNGEPIEICTSEVLRGPATDPVKTYRVIVDGDIGRVETDAAAVAKTIS